MSIGFNKGNAWSSVTTSGIAVLSTSLLSICTYYLVSFTC